MEIQVTGASDIGSLREENEDSFGTLELPNAWFLTVCDGMGGYAGGKLASQSAVDVLLEHVRAHHDPEKIGEVLEQAIHAANRAVRDKAKADERVGEMGTTCVAVLATPEAYWVAHVGDSRAYRLRDGVFSLLTEDHTVVQQLVNQGRIGPIEAANHPSAGILVRCLGQLDQVPVDISGPHPLHPGDRILLCSDGLSGMLYEDDIARVLANADPETAVAALIRYANEAGGFDNITAVCLAAGPLPKDASSWRIVVDSPEGKALAAQEARQEQTSPGTPSATAKAESSSPAALPDPDDTRELAVDRTPVRIHSEDGWGRVLLLAGLLALLAAAFLLLLRD